MDNRLFGTDGIRGLVNRYPMTPDLILKIGQAAGAHFLRGNHRHQVIIGKDTRLSGYMLEAALEAGFTSVGMDVILVGPLPSPAISSLTQTMRADLGVMISASHNDFHDNGIKIFGPDGYKLTDADEIAIEERIHNDMGSLLAAPDQIGRARRIEDARGRYIAHAKQSFPSYLRLDGLKIVIDCANGAGYTVAPAALWELGAEVITMGVEPNGININDDVGSTKPQALQQRVLKEQAHLGIALDGDADRLILVDEKGTIVDGDQIMALIALSWKQHNRLSKNTLVSTIMSNMGLELFLKDHEIALKRTKVGDRYVLEEMRTGGYGLGGEQSGHLIFADYSKTGDGLIAALQTLAVIVERGRPASELLSLFKSMPQILRNVRDIDKKCLSDETVSGQIRVISDQLGKYGRVIIRPSGTEPVIRIMVESEDMDQAVTIVDQLHEVIKEASD